MAKVRDGNMIAFPKYNDRRSIRIDNKSYNGGGGGLGPNNHFQRSFSHGSGFGLGFGSGPFRQGRIEYTSSFRRSMGGFSLGFTMSLN